VRRLDLWMKQGWQNYLICYLPCIMQHEHEVEEVRRRAWDMETQNADLDRPRQTLNVKRRELVEYLHQVNAQYQSRGLLFDLRYRHMSLKLCESALTLMMLIHATCPQGTHRPTTYLHTSLQGQARWVKWSAPPAAQHRVTLAMHQPSLVYIFIVFFKFPHKRSQEEASVGGKVIHG
jgi:hypothetical protein